MIVMVPGIPTRAKVKVILFPEKIVTIVKSRHRCTLFHRLLCDDEFPNEELENNTIDFQLRPPYVQSEEKFGFVEEQILCYC